MSTDVINGQTHPALAEACDDALLATMRPSFRRLIHDLVAEGHTGEEILAAVQQVDPRPRWQSLAKLQAEAAIDEALGRLPR